MKKLDKGLIKKIVLISISSIYTIFFIMVLTMPFGSKISNYVGNIINNVRDNVSFPISLDDNYFEFTDCRENITMGKNEVFPYQINNLIKYDMIQSLILLLHGVHYIADPPLAYMNPRSRPRTGYHQNRTFSP